MILICLLCKKVYKYFYNNVLIFIFMKKAKFYKTQHKKCSTKLVKILVRLQGCGENERKWISEILLHVIKVKTFISIKIKI